MPKITLTKKKIDSLKFTDKGQVIYWDTETPGLGLVVGMTVKTFRLQLDVKDVTKPKGYKTVKKTLGGTPLWEIIFILALCSAVKGRVISMTTGCSLYVDVVGALAYSRQVVA